MIYNYLFHVFCLVSCLFRALLEGERVSLQDAHRRVNQHQRERVIGNVLAYRYYILITKIHSKNDFKGIV